MQTKIKPNKLDFETFSGLFVLLLVIVLIGFFYFKDFKNDNKESIIDSNTQTTSFISDLIPIDDPKTIEANGFKITFPDGFQAVTRFRGSEYEIYQCIDSEGVSIDCDVTIISSPQNSIFVTAPSSFIIPDITGLDITKETVNIASYTTEITFVRYKLASYTDEIEVQENTGTKLNQQVFGCIENRLCFSSGLLATDPSNNQIETENFTNFLANLKVEQL